MTTLQFAVEGMTCEGCVNSIKRALSRNDKVKSCDVDLNAKKAKVETELPPTEIKAAIEKLGYSATFLGNAS